MPTPIQVLNADNATASPSLLLAFDTDRYLFNCGEGLQRLALEHKVRLSKIRTVIATRASTDTLAGLPGMLLTLSPAGPDVKGGGLVDVEPLQAKLVGPPGCRAYTEAFYPYASNNIALDVAEAGEGHEGEPVVRMRYVTIWAIYVHPPAVQQQEPRQLQWQGEQRAGGQHQGEQQLGQERGQPQEQQLQQQQEQQHHHHQQQQQQQQQQRHTNGNMAAGDHGPAAKKQRTGEPRAAHGDVAGATTAAPAAASPVVAAAAAAPAGSPEAVAGGVACYVCELADLPGKFDPARAKELGVPAGPMFGQLQRGAAVTTPSGLVVQPSDVMSAGVPGPLLLVVDCPTEAHTPALEAAPGLRALVQRLDDERAAVAGAAKRLVVVVHLAPADVSGSQAYAAFAARFGPLAAHLYVSAAGQATTTCRAAATLQAKLNALEPGLFPLGAIAAAAAAADAGADAHGSHQQQHHDHHHHHQQQQQQLQQQEKEKEQAQVGQQQRKQQEEAGAELEGLVVHGAQHLTRLALNPPKQRSWSSTAARPLQLAELRAGLLAAHPRVEALLSHFHARRAALLSVLGGAVSGGATAGSAVASTPGDAAAAAEAAAAVPACLRGVPRDELELVLLGTVSAQPSSYRNVSAYYLDCFARGGALADCGEDAMGQLERRYGVADAQRRVLDLALVWISHMHADHHGGLYPLLARREALGAPPLLVVGPFPLLRVLQEYSRVVSMRFVFLPSSYWQDAGQPGARQPPQPVLDALAAAVSRLGLASIEAFPVHHVARSTGLKVTGGGGGGARPPWSVVFSGDTRPCEAVASAARGAALLVHEATFEDELASDAAAKRHSTLSEALGIAAASGAYRTLLTHFSGRYPKIPVLAAPGPAAGAAGAQPGGGGGGGCLPGLVGSSVAVGFDFMSVNLADLPWVPLIVPACDELLREEGFADGGDDDGGGGDEDEDAGGAGKA